MKLDWLTDDGVNISWDNGVVDAPQEFLDNVDFLVDAKVRVRSPRFYFAEEVAGMNTMVGALLTVEFLLDVLGVGLVEAPMPFGESDVFVTDNHDVFDGSGEFEKAKFSSRSEAGKYAAHIRWMNQRGMTPLSAEAWTASQSADATPVVTDPIVPSRLTATGMDWDTPPPAFASMDDAITWLQAKWGGETTAIYDRFRKQGADPKTDHLAQAYATSIDNLFKFSPTVANTIEAVVWDENAIVNSWGQASRDGHSLLFYANTFVKTLIQPDGTVISSEQYAQFAKTQAFMTGFKSSSSLSSTFYHEFGHHIGFAAGNKALYNDVKETHSSWYADKDDRKKYTRELAKLVSPILREHYGVLGRARIDLKNATQADQMKIADDISRYATTNYDELVAESAAQYFAAKFEPDQPPANPLAIKIIETLLNYIEGENK